MDTLKEVCAGMFEQHNSLEIYPTCVVYALHIC